MLKVITDFTWYRCWPNGFLKSRIYIFETHCKTTAQGTFKIWSLLPGVLLIQGHLTGKSIPWSSLQWSSGTGGRLIRVVAMTGFSVPSQKDSDHTPFTMATALSEQNWVRESSAKQGVVKYRYLMTIISHTHTHFNFRMISHLLSSV